MNALNNIITARLDSKPRIKRIAAIVTEIVANTDNGKVKVRFMNSKNEESVLTLLNKSRDELAVGDSVWIHYWNTVSDGYVAIKTGLSSFDSESPTYPLPLHTNSLVTDTYCFTKKTSTHNTNYSFALSTTQETSQISYPTIGQVEEIVYTYDGQSRSLYQTPFTMYNGQVFTALSDYPWVHLSIDVYDNLTLSTYRNGMITSVRYTMEFDSQNRSILVRYIGGEREVVLTYDDQYTYKFALLNSETLTYNPNIPAVVGSFTIIVCYYDGGWAYMPISVSSPQESIVLNNNTINVQTTKTTVTKQTSTS